MVSAHRGDAICAESTESSTPCRTCSKMKQKLLPWSLTSAVSHGLSSRRLASKANVAFWRSVAVRRLTHLCSRSKGSVWLDSRALRYPMKMNRKRSFNAVGCSVVDTCDGQREWSLPWISPSKERGLEKAAERRPFYYFIRSTNSCSSFKQSNSGSSLASFLLPGEI
jgi:hypothetical protein